MQILALDIETAPNIVYAWDLYNEFTTIDKLIESTEMLSFAAKWIDRDKVHFHSTHHTGHDQMVRHAHDLLNTADVVLHYNGKRFDVPHLNREFLALGLDPPAPYQQIDLLETAKRQFKFPSNKLAYVSEALGLEGKTEHEGFPLWIKCMAGDKRAWKTMREYNIQDVVLLEKLYNRLLPWIQRHPSHGAMNGRDCCPTCGGVALQHRGYSYTRTGKYQRFQCKDCGKWSRATRRTSGTRITEVAC